MPRKRKREAAFGEGSILLDCALLNPRHLEVQIAGDRTGGLVHLFERDCSVQRNNQKVLEEAAGAEPLGSRPHTGLFDAALQLGRAIGYDFAGTVEFIMEQGSDRPYFLEMNTRLQVEHPVTELITGIDLVEWQLLAAAGEKLPLAQDQIRVHGHAIEARITAERADLGFAQVTGELALVDAPRSLRFDSGVAAGSRVSLYYIRCSPRLSRMEPIAMRPCRDWSPDCPTSLCSGFRPRKPFCVTRFVIRCSETATPRRASSRPPFPADGSRTRTNCGCCAPLPASSGPTRRDRSCRRLDQSLAAPQRRPSNRRRAAREGVTACRG